MVLMDWNLGTAARTLWQEARGEAIEGQRAIAHVLVNRLKDGRWGDMLGDVCLWHAQFSAWGNPNDPNFKPSCGLHDDDPLLIEFSALIQAALGGEPDPTAAATHYYNPKIRKVPPPWTIGAILCGKFGNQLFYRGVK